MSRPKSAKFQLFSLEENIEYIAIIDETQFCMINRSTHYLNLYKNTLVPMVKYLDENHKLRVSYNNIIKIFDRLSLEYFNQIQARYTYFQHCNRIQSENGASNALDLIYNYYFHPERASFSQSLLDLYALEQAFQAFDAKYCNAEIFINSIYPGIHLCLEEELDKKLEFEQVNASINASAREIHAQIVSEIKHLIKSPPSISGQLRLGFFAHKTNTNLKSISAELENVSQSIPH